MIENSMAQKRKAQEIANYKAQRQRSVCVGGRGRLVEGLSQLDVIVTLL